MNATPTIPRHASDWLAAIGLVVAAFVSCFVFAVTAGVIQ